MQYPVGNASHHLLHNIFTSYCIVRGFKDIFPFCVVGVSRLICLFAIYWIMVLYDGKYPYRDLVSLTNTKLKLCVTVCKAFVFRFRFVFCCFFCFRFVFCFSICFCSCFCSWDQINKGLIYVMDILYTIPSVCIVLCKGQGRKIEVHVLKYSAGTLKSLLSRG